MNKHIKLLFSAFIISICILAGCSKSSSAVDKSTYRLEFNSNFFQEINADMVYKIEYSLGGLEDVEVSDDAHIADIISLLKSMDLAEKEPKEEIREGGTVVRIITSNGTVSFIMFGPEILGNGAYYEINEEIENKINDLFIRLRTETMYNDRRKNNGMDK